MSRREDIENSVWADPDFESLSANATLLYLWSFTNPRCGMAGMYKVSHRAMTESKVALDDIPAALDELATAGFAFYEQPYLWVRTRVKHLRVRSSQMAKSIANDIQRVPPAHPLRVRFVAEYGTQNWLREQLADVVKGTSPEPTVNLTETPVNSGDSHTFTRTSPEVPGQGQWEGQGSSSSSEGGVGGEARPVVLPAGFPAELRPHLRSVFRVLRDLAQRHNAKAVSPTSLASTVMGNQHKPLVSAAFRFASWADDQAQRRKDVIAGYRNWLLKENDLAGVERLDARGLPASGAALSSPSRRDPSAILRNLFASTEPDASTEAPEFVDAEVVEDEAA